MKVRKVLEEGDLTNGLFRSRFGKNKNVLLAVTGPTGSGKSYSCLRVCELWYKEKFNKPFPIENICFSLGEAMKRISSGKLERGELLIMEEMGVGLGSLDFQNKTSKMFVYTLQSFRSLNIGLIMNLPVLTMLNKSARLLLHGHLITQTIDHAKKEVKLKPLMHQLNQHSGKSYWKFPRAKVGHKYLAIQRLSYKLPSNDLITQYEQKKTKFLSNMTNEFSKEFDKIEFDKVKAMARADLTEKQMDLFNLLQEGKAVKDIAQMKGVAQRSIYTMIEAIKKKGYDISKPENTLVNPIIDTQGQGEGAF